MKSVKSGLAVLVILLMVIIIPSDAGSMWFMDDGEQVIMGDYDELMLSRIDPDTDAPLHEFNEGVYGFWDINSVWIMVIDFNTSQGIVAPFTWEDVKWIPGSMDKGFEY